MKKILFFLVFIFPFSFNTQVKANADCVPVFNAFWLANNPYPVGMTPLFDVSNGQCVFKKWITIAETMLPPFVPVSTITPTIPQTTTSTLVLKKDQKIPLKDLINTTTTIDYSHELKNAGLLLGSPTTTIDWVETVFATTTVPNLIIKKEKKMNENLAIAIAWASVISLIVICVYFYFKNRLKLDSLKQEREYNLRVKDSELHRSVALQQAELEKYKTLQLSKTQMDNEHEVALKKLEFDKSLDARDFMLTVTKDEREYLLKQRELDIQEGKPSTSFMDMIDSNKDVQLRLKK
jgi:uncharacterized membrane protein YciS (DUF1049 family)